MEKGFSDKFGGLGLERPWQHFVHVSDDRWEKEDLIYLSEVNSESQFVPSFSTSSLKEGLCLRLHVSW